jgi:hypothetical protein
MAYDATRQTVVVFGGLDPGNMQPVQFADTWEWNGMSWAARASAVRPTERYRHAMTYDAVRQRVVLFGGDRELIPFENLLLADTWLWDGVNWAQAHPVPTGRQEHAMAYDAARHRVVLFGRRDYNRLEDTWE